MIYNKFDLKKDCNNNSKEADIIAKDFETFWRSITKNINKNYEKHQAYMKLQECMFWCIKSAGALERHQVERQQNLSTSNQQTLHTQPPEPNYNTKEPHISYKTKRSYK